MRRSVGGVEVDQDKVVGRRPRVLVDSPRQLHLPQRSHFLPEQPAEHLPQRGILHVDRLKELTPAA